MDKNDIMNRYLYERGMKHMKKFFSILFTFIFLLISIGHAETINSIDLARELIDIVSNAAISSEATLENKSDTGDFNQNFISNFITIAAKYLEDNTLLNDKEKQRQLLNECFAENITIPENILLNTGNDYIGAKIMFLKEYGDNSVKIVASIYTAPDRIDKLQIKDMPKLNWIDKRIVLGLVKNSNSRYGYSITDYSLSGELSMENEIEEYFQNNYFEYINSRFGFSLQLPTAFESGISETDDGIKSIDKNSGTNLFVKTYENKEHWTAKSFYDSLIASGNKYAKLFEETSVVTEYEIKDDKILIYKAYLFSDNNVYLANIEFDKAEFENYSLNFEYLKNTFMVLNNEIG